MALRTRWLLYAMLAAIPVVGGFGGMVVAASKAPTYTAEARLAVVLTDLQTSQQLAANFSRFLTSESVVAKLDAGTSQQLVSVAASPIPDSNMIRVEAEGTSPLAALDAAKVATAVLQDRVVALSGKAAARQTLVEYTRVSQQVAVAQEKVNASGGRGASFTANAPRLATLQAQAQALNTKYQNQTTTGAATTQLSLVRPAVGTVDNARSRRQVYLLAGFGGGALIAYVLGRLATGLLESLARRSERSGDRDAARSPRLVDVRSRDERARDQRARDRRSRDELAEETARAGPTPDEAMDGAHLLDEDRYVTDHRLLSPDRHVGDGRYDYADDPYPAEADHRYDESYPDDERFGSDDAPVRSAAPVRTATRAPRPADRPVDRPVDRPADRQPAPPSPRRPAAQPVMRPAHQPAPRSAHQPAPPAHQPADQPAPQPVPRPVPQPVAPLRSGAPAVRPQSHAAGRPAAPTSPIQPGRTLSGLPADLAPYGRRRVADPASQPAPRGPARPAEAAPPPPARRQWP